jgi:single-strand DNA-binding protein
MLNKIILIGNVGQDPEIKTLPSGSHVANFSLATTEYWKDKAGNRQSATEWHRIVVYNENLVKLS